MAGKGAIQVADDATELVRALKGSALADRARLGQRRHPVAAVRPPGRRALPVQHGRGLGPDAASSGSGATAPLPTTAISMTINGVAFAQHWYVGRCWQPDAGGDCGTRTRPERCAVLPRRGRRDVVRDALPRSLVLVRDHRRWSAAPRGTRVFNANETAVAPTVSNPGNQTGQVARGR